MTNINTILQEYHQKFDDQEVRELLENLESMMYERASFFRNLPETNNEQLAEEIDGYWRELDDLGYGSSMHDEILDKLRDNVTGLGMCGCCRKMGIIKPRVLSSVLSDKVYIGKLCETCISKKNWIMTSKEEVEKDTLVPLELPELEKQLMTQYQNTLQTGSS